MELIYASFHQLLVFIHLFVFAFSVVEVIKKDVNLIVRNKFSLEDIRSTARLLTGLLAVLWITGLTLIYISIGWDLQALLSNSKLMAKITVVLILTINGIALHFIAFPLMARPRLYSGLICSILGSISAVSWVFASFIGAARIMAPELSYTEFMASYLVGLAVALGIAILFAKNRIQHIISPSMTPSYLMNLDARVRW